MSNDQTVSYLRRLLKQAQEDIDQGLLAAAESRYRHAMTMMPDNPQLHLTMGLLLLEQGRNPDAVTELEHAIRLDSDNPSAYKGLARARQAMGQTNAAHAAFNAAALKTRPSTESEKEEALHKDNPATAGKPPGSPRHGDPSGQHRHHRRSGPAIKKVLLVSPLYGGSLEVVRNLASGFDAAGVTTLLMDNSDCYPYYQKIETEPGSPAEKEIAIDNMLAGLDRRLLDCAERFKPDLVVAIAQSPLGSQAIQKLRSNGIISAYWFVEDYRFKEYWAEIAPDYDFFFMIQRDDHLKARFHAMGYDCWHYLPLACEPSVHKPWNGIGESRRRYSCQIGFMGAPYLNRLKIFDQLTQYDLKIWGEGWSSYEVSPELKACVQEGERRISPEESVRIYSSADITVNLHSSPFVEGISAEGEFVNPRTFEVAGCGGFQMTDYRCEIPHLFTPDEEIILFHDLEELHALIKFWLPRHQLRAEISRRAQARAYARHTYRQRAKEIVATIEAANK